MIYVWHSQQSVFDIIIETIVSAYFTVHILRKRVEDDLLIVYMAQYYIELVYSYCSV